MLPSHPGVVGTCLGWVVETMRGLGDHCLGSRGSVVE